MYWRILFANQHPKRQKDTVIQDEIWQEYNTLSTTNNSFPGMLAPDLCIISQVFVFKKTAVSARGRLTAVMNALEKSWLFSFRC
jgi:hypothetical protein